MEIIYLLKFTSQYEHAKDLLDGKLFMNQAAYYHDLEVGQGDIREGAFSHKSMAYMGSSRPIYCMYAVYEYQFIDNKIIIPKKIVSEFQSEYIVIIKYKEFIQKLINKELKTKFALTMGDVKYRFLSVEDSHKILEGNANSLLYKHPYYKYQQEYRIIVHENLEDITEKRFIDGIEVDCIVGRESITYSLKGDLRRIARIIKIDECHIVGENLFINPNLEGILSP